MKVLASLVHFSIKFRYGMAGLLAVLLVAGGFAAHSLPIDAEPDVSTVQVAVLTEAQGLSPIEVERTVTLPVELALNGCPGLTELRSISRTGLSAVTVIFADGTDIWFARQVVLERIRSAEAVLPRAAGRPELSPASGGLGQIYQFVVRSDHHAATQLRTILDWDIVPRLRSVPGVTEVNTMGGELKEYQVVLDRGRLHAHDITLEEVAQALERANTNVGGGYVERGAEQLNVRGLGVLRDENEIGDVVIRSATNGSPVLVKHVATVKSGTALRHGVVTRDGEGEAVVGVVMMLLGSNSRDVVKGVKARLDEVQTELPPGVRIEPFYDRSDFVGRTLDTVLHNLIEGALVVAVVLTLFLGSLRGALVVVLGIPASMAFALFGMHLFGVTGDLMSLGAIDFGFLVDGAIVLLETTMAVTAGKIFRDQNERAETYAEAAATVAKPVAFAVAIILLVYVPLLSLQGVEGKMFRPMATTMACALLGSLVYALAFFPALLVLCVPPAKGHGPRWMEWVIRQYEKHLAGALRARWLLIGLSAASLVGSVVLLGRAGADFLPRIDEGDMVVTIRRAPSINLHEAKELDLQTEKVLHRFPEVVTAVALTGRAEVAVDPVGSDNTDVYVHLKPKGEWTVPSLETLAAKVKAAIEGEVPGTFVSISQPIENKTNELISGSQADVQIQISGDDLDELRGLTESVGAIARDVKGTGDLRIERVLGLPTLTVVPDRARLARYGARMEDALSAVAAARVGLPLGVIYEGERRFDLRLIAPPRAPTAEALGELFVEAAGGTTVPLSEVATVLEEEGPLQVRRQSLSRAARVEVNLRGRDLVSWVEEAQTRVAREVPLKNGYTIEWGGQFENFQRAKARLGMVVPVSLTIIFGMLFGLFGSARYAAAVFALVPFALTGGMLGIVARGLSFSIPGAVGLIALAGVAVLNGVVMASDVKKRLEAGEPLDQAVREGAAHTARAVLTTSGVAALGFLPMALATGAGSEVQRPLATAVVAGILFSSLLTLYVLPGVLRIALGGLAAKAPAKESPRVTAPPGDPGERLTGRVSAPAE